MLENVEVWKDCKGYEGKYQVSSQGRIWSSVRQHYLKQKINNRGYYSVNLMAKNGKMKTENVHRLVAIAFIDNPNSYPFVNHLNGIKTDNRIENLEWATPQQNIRHAYDNNLGNFQENLAKIQQARQKTYSVYYYGNLIGQYRGMQAAAEAAGCSTRQIADWSSENRKTRDGYYLSVGE